MAELIDLLDEKGNVVGVVDRAVAHKTGQWHRSVHVWIINDKNEFLLQHRCKSKKIFPSCWDCAFAGHVDAGESSLESALREGKEEIGLDLCHEDFEFLFTYKDRLEYGNLMSNEFVDVYLIKKNVDISKLKLQKAEVDDVKWTSQEKFFDSIFSKRGDFLFHGLEEYERLKKYLNLDKNA